MIDRDVILHCHLFKNAGTTLDWALERNFKQGFFDHRDDEKMRRYGIDHVDDFLLNNPDIVALSSHHMPFMPEYSKNYRWLILLREPLRRVRSVYEFEVRQRPASSLGSKMAKKLNFAEYINWRMQDDVPAVIRDFHVRYIANTRKSLINNDDSLLDRAMDRLSLGNVLVGTVEKFDESMVMFEEQLKGNIPEIDLSYVKQNVGRNIKGSPLGFLDDLPAETRDILVEKNRLDKRFYEMVSDQQNEHISKIEGIDDKLCDFKKRCESLAVKRYAWK